MTIRVVIAEDEAIIRLDLKETLEEEGYDVVGETGRGDKAVELVRELKPDLAILDIKMPGMDGLEAAAIINAERLCGVLILTAFSQREIIEQARDSGALAYLVKPYQKSDLIPAIEVAIGRFRELQSLSGEVTYDGTIARDGRYDFTSHSGTVRLLVPADAGISLTASTFSGSVNSRLPATLGPTRDGGGVRRGGRMELTINGGGARVNATSFSGDIVIERSDARSPGRP